MQREMFRPRELNVEPPNGSVAPRLWVRRLILWSEPGVVIRDISFGPGLNIIWSPDPADTGARRENELAPSGTGHGAGKTLVCRLLRYCLGESNFAPGAQHAKICSAFKDGRVGAEIVVDGVVWAVVRSIGVFPHDVVLEGGGLEAAVASELAPTGMSPFIVTLSRLFLTPEVADVVADAPDRAWLLAIAWLTRDQECRFGKVTEWRAAGSDSGSPARRLGVGDATNIVRALLGAITPREHRLEDEIVKIGKERGDTATDLERHRWVLSQSVARVAKAVGLEGRTLPAGALLGEFLRNEAKARVGQVAVVNAKNEVSSLDELEAKYESAQEDLQRIEREIASAENERTIANAVAKQIVSETPGLTASLDEAELPTCPVCEVPIDRALAEGCKLSHKLPDLVTLSKRREKNEADLRAKEAEAERSITALTRLAPELGAAKALRDELKKSVRAARQLRNERSEAWYAARRIGDDIGEIEKDLAQEVAAEAELAALADTLEQKHDAVGVERARHALVFARLGEHFDPIVRRLLGKDAQGRVEHDGRGLHLTVEYGGERSTPAIESVKVLAFDLATLCRSIEAATHLPALLIHDSPREADLGLSVYHELFHLMLDLEKVGSTPQFQYIVTTTTRPPDDLADDPRVRLKLNGAPAEERLLRRDL
jgi:hypothetical protein